MLFLVVEPSKTISLIKNTIPQNEDIIDIIFLFNGYHSIPKINTTQQNFGLRGQGTQLKILRVGFGAGRRNLTPDLLHPLAPNPKP